MDTFSMVICYVNASLFNIFYSHLSCPLIICGLELEVWLQKMYCLSPLGSLKGATPVDVDSTFSC